MSAIRGVFAVYDEPSQKLLYLRYVFRALFGGKATSNFALYSAFYNVMPHVSFLDLISRSEDIDGKRRLAIQKYRFHCNKLLLERIGQSGKPLLDLIKTEYRLCMPRVFPYVAIYSDSCLRFKILSYCVSLLPDFSSLQTHIFDKASFVSASFSV